MKLFYRAASVAFIVFRIIWLVVAVFLWISGLVYFIEDTRFMTWFGWGIACAIPLCVQIIKNSISSAIPSPVYDDKGNTFLQPASFNQRVTRSTFASGLSMPDIMPITSRFTILVRQGEKIEYGSFAESTKPTTSAS